MIKAEELGEFKKALLEVTDFLWKTSSKFENA